jgi:hypothetical protein
MQELSSIWSLIRGTVIWILWLARNAKVFCNELWTQEQLNKQLWDGILDHPRKSWYKISRIQKEQPAALPNAQEKV